MPYYDLALVVLLIVSVFAWIVAPDVVAHFTPSLVDCDADLSGDLDEGETFVFHAKCGQVDVKSITLFNSGTHPETPPNELVALNAIMLVYLLEHPVLIPREWAGKIICFQGTICRDKDGRPFVLAIGEMIVHWWSLGASWVCTRIYIDEEGAEDSRVNGRIECPTAVVTRV